MITSLPSFSTYTSTADIHTLSLHDALPICSRRRRSVHLQHTDSLNSAMRCDDDCTHQSGCSSRASDRKSTRLNSSHANISYAVFCLKKKKISKGICGTSGTGYVNRRSFVSR